MDAGDWIATVSAVAAIATCVVAEMALRTARRDLTYHHLSELMREYAEPMMSTAVKELWTFFEGQNSDSERLKATFAQMLTECSDEHVSSQRRRVSHFYQRMAALYHGGLLPKKVLYCIWFEENVRIIPKIIIPLEEALYVHRRGKRPTHEFDFLRHLYNDSIDANR